MNYLLIVHEQVLLCEDTRCEEPIVRSPFFTLREQAALCDIND